METISRQHPKRIRTQMVAYIRSSSPPISLGNEMLVQHATYYLISASSTSFRGHSLRQACCLAPETRKHNLINSVISATTEDGPGRRGRRRKVDSLRLGLLQSVAGFHKGTVPCHQELDGCWLNGYGRLQTSRRSKTRKLIIRVYEQKKEITRLELWYRKCEVWNDKV